MTEFVVNLSNCFLSEYLNYPSSDVDKIDTFIEHYQEYGFNGLTGKNVPSCNVPTNDREFVQKVQYAKLHKLWHYHIGIPEYQLSACGKYQTSEYVIHYQRLSLTEIKIVDFSYHPPLTLPSEQYLR